IDAVVIFEEETPQNIINVLMPDVLVKGGDYTIDKIVGAKEVLANGGEVRQLQFVEGYSTTAIEQKIIAASLKK
ncbi:MAG: D-glycero-beta-D-manno-heptose 1-phosphate adenylyltransferase, partial [Salibacteraceae bacterium]|nr:D-glycero-beta-D-manno-heptose 1-phosphate adenylyltransferase [Salibacteraceae bacterium]